MTLHGLCSLISLNPSPAVAYAVHRVAKRWQQARQPSSHAKVSFMAVTRNQYLLFQWQVLQQLHAGP